MAIIIQQDATIYSLFISVNCSACFGWYLHPSSGAQITASTVFGINETVTATCRERDWMGTTALHVSGGISTHHQELVSLYLQYPVLMRPLLLPVVNGWELVPIQSRSGQVAVTVSLMPDTVETMIRAPDDGWRYHPKHAEQFTDINELYIVASCWIIIATCYTMYGPLNIKLTSCSPTFTYSLFCK